jgi:hypothetical protein
MTTYLRFPDEATAKTVLADYLAEDDTWITASHSHALDVIGFISIGGEYDPETGDVLAPPTVLDGWHVNYTGELPEVWDAYTVSPKQPVRMWL